MSDIQISGADLTINCSDGKLYYTRYLLQRISYYNCIINGGFKESTINEINFKYSIKIFKLLVKFIETNKLDKINYDDMYMLYKLSVFTTYTELHEYIMSYNLDYRIYYKAVELDDIKTLEKIKNKYSVSNCSVNEINDIRKNISGFYEFIITKYNKYLYIFDKIVPGYITKSIFKLAFEHDCEYVIINYLNRKYFRSYSATDTYDFMTQYPVKIIGYVIKAAKLERKNLDTMIVALNWLKFNPGNKDTMFQYIIDNYKLFKNSSFVSLYKIIDMFQDDYEKIKQIIKFELYKNK